MIKKNLRQKLQARQNYVGQDVKEMTKHYAMSKDELGRGAFSVVRLAQDKRTKKLCAVKIMKKKGLALNEIDHMHQEIGILKDLDHENIIKTKDVYENHKAVWIFTEFAAGGELMERLMGKKNYSEEDAKTVIRQVVDGLKYCYEKGIVHRDLKPDNILLMTEHDDTNIKIADFGFATRFDPIDAEETTLHTACGSFSYVAPEVVVDGSRRKYNYKCDVWSLGILTYVLISGYLPFSSRSKEEFLKRVQQGEFTFRPKNAWKNVSDRAKDFIRNLLKSDPEERLSYEEMKEHPWLEEGVEDLGDLTENLESFRAFNEDKKRFARAKVRAHAAAMIMEQLMNDDIIEDEEVFEE